jgi:hypothetical protein
MDADNSTESVASLDEPVEVASELIQPSDRLWRNGSVSLKQLALNSYSRDFDRRGNNRGMKVAATGVAADFVQQESGRSVGKTYFHPNPAQLEDDTWFVILRDVQAGVLVPVSEERLEALISSGVLEVA